MFNRPSDFRVSTRRRLAGLAAAVVLVHGVVASPEVVAETPAAPAKSLQLFTDSKIKSFDRFSVEVIGHGPDLILIPGLACSREVWHQTAERLRDSHTLHIVQIAGFAGEPSRGNAKGPVIDPVVSGLDQYIVDNRLAPVLVIGHSLGGTVALRLAQQHPTDVKKVLLVDSLPFYSVLIGGPAATPDSVRPTAEALQKQMAAPLTDSSRATSKAMIQRMVTAPEKVDLVTAWGASSDRPVVGQALYDDLTLDMRPGLATMVTPVTLIYPFDAKSGVALETWDNLYHSQFEPIPHKTLVRVDDSKHFIMYDQPGKFAAAVDAFLQQ
jgi:pimeloyl-ACP methyl ester carboxylesterase